MPGEVVQILVPLLSHCHSAFQDSQDAVPLGPFFPRRGHPLPSAAGKGIARPLRPMVQMTVPNNQLECSRVSMISLLCKIFSIFMAVKYQKKLNTVNFPAIYCFTHYVPTDLGLAVRDHSLKINVHLNLLLAEINNI